MFIKNIQEFTFLFKEASILFTGNACLFSNCIKQFFLCKVPQTIKILMMIKLDDDAISNQILLLKHMQI